MHVSSFLPAPVAADLLGEGRFPPHKHADLSLVVDRPDRRMSVLLRARSYVRRARFRGTLLRPAAALATEWLRACRDDVRERRTHMPRITRVLPAAGLQSPLASVALFVHYAPASTVSGMVLGQLRAYRDLGFQVVFISMASPLTSEALASLHGLAALVVERRNFGLDFGAWQDVLPLVQTDGLRELLLVNDSVCGPLRPLEPVIAAMRGAGAGLYGMTENLAPRPHLQSYFLLARGGNVIADLRRFLGFYRQTAYKRAVVRQGEVALSGWMRAQGHRVVARFGYDAVERAALDAAPARRRLARRFPLLVDSAAGLPGPLSMAAKLKRFPLNPAHSLWFELTDRCGFPFVKTELLLRNPIGVPDTADWHRLVPMDQAGLEPAIAAHLALMRGPPDSGRKQRPGAPALPGAASWPTQTVA